MLASTRSGAVRGIEGFLVRVEVHVDAGLKAFRTVGLPDSAVRESKDRVRSALKNSGFEVPEGRITINLAPAYVKKQGSAFDLALALGLIAALRKKLPERLRDTLFLGELSLDGRLRPVRGVLPVIQAALRDPSIARAVVPRGNAPEAGLVRGLPVYAAGSLREAVDLLDGCESSPLPTPSRRRAPERSSLDIAEVKGQRRAKRALEIAAAGGHHLLLVGPPGAGKTLLAKRLPSLLPLLGWEAALEVTTIYSAAGRVETAGELMSAPPFRAPHHTISYAGMVGGSAGPGEVSLAHHGVLFLDELPEFPRAALEALRQPLEEGAVRISRAQGTSRFPARFSLVAAMNPCPCGYLGAEARACACTPSMVQRYRSRISGPLLDRIDLQVPVRPLTPNQMFSRTEGESSAVVRARVAAARKAQQRRFRKSPSRLNAELRPRELERYCRLGASEKEVLLQAVRHLGLSARAFDRILKVSRTIADLDGSDGLEPSHLREAVQYRMLEQAGAASPASF